MSHLYLKSCGFCEFCHNRRPLEIIAAPSALNESFQCADAEGQKTVFFSTQFTLIAYIYAPYFSLSFRLVRQLGHYLFSLSFSLSYHRRLDCKRRTIADWRRTITDLRPWLELLALQILTPARSVTTTIEEKTVSFIAAIRDPVLHGTNVIQSAIADFGRSTIGGASDYRSDEKKEQNIYVCPFAGRWPKYTKWNGHTGDWNRTNAFHEMVTVRPDD